MGSTVGNARWSESCGFLFYLPKSQASKVGVVYLWEEATLEEGRAAPSMAGNVQGTWEQLNSDDWIERYSA